MEHIYLMTRYFKYKFYNKITGDEMVLNMFKAASYNTVKKNTTLSSFTEKKSSDEPASEVGKA